MNNNDITIKRTILYYPTISVPTGNWLRQAILYWDEVSSIVPKSWDEGPLIAYTPDIQFLKAEGEFRPIAPDELFKLNNYRIYEEFEQEFKNIIESKFFRKLIPPQTKHNLTDNIYKDKISHSLVYKYLEHKGLAKRNKDSPKWYLFENNTALLYMSLLAKYLADIDIQSTVVGTDRKEYESLIFIEGKITKRFSCIDARFRNILPIPSEENSFDDILRFKRKRKQELIYFRTLMDEFQKKLSEVNNRSDINDVLVKFKEKIEKGVSDLNELFKDSGIRAITSSFKTIVNVKSPTLWGTLGVGLAKVSKIDELPLEYVLSGLAIVGCIEIGMQMIDERNKKRATLRASPFSYLYHAKVEGII